MSKGISLQRNKLSPGEVEQLIAISKDNYFYPFMSFAISSGLRGAELLGLRWRDIDLDRGLKR